MKQFRKYLYRANAVLLVVAVFLAGFVLGNLNGNSVTEAQTNFALGDTDEAFEALWEAYDAIQSRYVDSGEITVPELVDGAIKGMVDSLGDPYSGYLDPDAFTMFSSDISGDVEGIGVVIRTIEETGAIEVVTVLEGAPARAAGVLPGDIFYEVDGQSVIGLNQTELASIVRGESGSSVNITFLRGEELVEFTIVRARFEVPNVTTDVYEDSNIAYISMAEFNSRSREQVDEALVEVDVNSRNGLIFDLRGNPGGLLSSAVDIGSLFVEEGVLIYETFGDGSEQIFEANGDFGGITVPIVLLVDESSASASELIAGALKDTGVATLIGETTFGKGTVQTIQPLSNDGGLRLTIARWLTPQRNWIHDQGVTPNIEVEWNPETIEELEGEDPQLQAAIDFLTNQ